VKPIKEDGETTGLNIYISFNEPFDLKSVPKKK